MAKYGLAKLPTTDLKQTTALPEIIKTGDDLGDLLSVLLLRLIEKIQHSYGKVEQYSSEFVIFALKDRILFRSGTMLASQENFTDVFRISYLHQKSDRSNEILEEELVECSQSL